MLAMVLKIDVNIDFVKSQTQYDLVKGQSQGSMCGLTCHS